MKKLLAVIAVWAIFSPVAQGQIWPPPPSFLVERAATDTPKTVQAFWPSVIVGVVNLQTWNELTINVYKVVVALQYEGGGNLFLANVRIARREGNVYQPISQPFGLTHDSVVVNLFDSVEIALGQPAELAYVADIPQIPPQWHFRVQTNAIIGVVGSTQVRGGGTPFYSSWIGVGQPPLPIQLANFTGISVGNNSVRLDWITLSELNNYGFYVQRRVESEQEFTELPNSFVPGAGTSIEPQYYSWIDANAGSGIWYYRLKQVDLDGSIHYTDQIQVDVLTSVKHNVPIKFALLQNYPNPFNPSTEIKFSVETTAHAVLEVYNMIGQRVGSLFDDVAEAGHDYKVKFDASGFTSSVYFYHLQSGERSEIKKMTLLK